MLKRGALADYLDKLIDELAKGKAIAADASRHRPDTGVRPMGSSGARKPAATRKQGAAARQAVTNRRGAGGKAALRRRRRAIRGTRRPARRTPSVIPMISYEDGIRALGWLSRAFGFRETTRLAAPDGRLAHGEMRAGDGLIMLASPTPDYRGPKRHRETCEQARRWSTVPWVIDGVLVFVAHLERHLARARAAGATILSEIEEGPPGRRYRAEDLEGHRWFFFEKDA
jgi:uncharacterized glyoxalase superfamily protein PhnB